MLKRRFLNSALAGLAVAVVAVGGTAATASARTLSFVSVNQRTIRTPDGVTFVDVARDADGQLLGADTIQCRYAAASAHCAIGVSLRAGTLYLTAVDRKSGLSGRLVAGTGVYAGDGGTVVAKPVAPGQTQVTVRLGPAPSVHSPTRPMRPLRFVATLRWVYVPGGFVMTDFDSNPGGGLIGTDTVNCRAQTTHGCYATVDLPAGTLYISLLLGHFADTGRVVAGTGRFAGARGHVIVSDITQMRSMVTVEFYGS